MSEDKKGAAKLADLAKDIVGMLTTDDDGHFVSRPMAQQEVEFDGDLWFFAERDSRKVAHIAANPHVGVTLTSNDTWISIDGEAEIVEDKAKAKELWNSWVEAWLPQGPEDPSVVLIKVNGHSGRVLGHPGRPDRLGDQLRQGQGHRPAVRRLGERDRPALSGGRRPVRRRAAPGRALPARCDPPGPAGGARSNPWLICAATSSPRPSG